MDCLHTWYARIPFRKTSIRNRMQEPLFALQMKQITKTINYTKFFRGHPFKTLAFFKWGGVKNWPNLPMDSSKKLPTVRG